MAKYLTIQNQEKSEFKDRGSKFIAYCFKVYNKNEIEEFLGQVAKEHPKSRHVCYAYLLLDDFRANDDGEPSGSAGLPILNQIKSADLNYTLVAVVRYFGGTKLGVSGLINAYKTSAKSVLEVAGFTEEEEQEYICIKFGYEHMETVMSFIKHNNALVLSQQFEKSCTLDIQIRKDDQLRYFEYFEKHGISAS